jgi:small RNA 2'-O-methyltransferase
LETSSRIVPNLNRRSRRRAAAAKLAFATGGGCGFRPGHEGASTLHQERLETAVRLLLESGAASVLDLGCGAGALLSRLAGESQFTKIVGVDVSPQALMRAERDLELIAGGTARVSLMLGSITEAQPELVGFDAAAMVETIEHIEPQHLSKVERTVFLELRPALAIVTTPNREYNALYNMAPGQLRHADHRFEWTRARFQAWAAGVAARTGYRVEFEGAGPADPLLGTPTQIGVFRLLSKDRLFEAE